MTPNGTAVRALRQARDLSIRDLARLTGLDRGYLSRLERGHAGARVETLQRVAAALAVPLAAINREEEEASS